MKKKKILLILGILLLIGCIQNDSLKDRTNELEIIKEIESRQHSFEKVSPVVRSFLIIDEFVTEDLKYKINIDCRDLQETIDYKYIQENQNDEFIKDFINPIFELCKNIFPKLFIENDWNKLENKVIQCDSPIKGEDLLILTEVFDDCWIKDTEEEYSSITRDCDGSCLKEGSK